MKSMLYYPGFEVENAKWLKFALLYFEELRPIIPYIQASEELYLSENARRIMGETNLIRPYCPNYEEGYMASIIACKEFDLFFQNPRRYSYAFEEIHNHNMMDIWKNPSNQTCKLYEGKFSYEFYDYCIKSGIATPFSEGIQISKDLAFVYMSFLADVISKKQGYEMFTDIRRYDRLLTTNDRKLMNAQGMHYLVAKTEIEFNIPVDINKIPLEAMIRLRSNRDFENCRKAYVEEIQRYLSIRESDPNATFDDQLNIRRELLRILGLSFGALSAVCLTSVNIQSFLHGAASPAFALAAAYADLQELRGLRHLRRDLDELRTRVQAKRYFGHIKRISAPYKSHAKE